MKLHCPRHPTLSLLVIAALLLLPAIAGAADQKLILKDGTDHLVRSYEVIGDRVRYYSAERQDWEEIPASLVDWEATENARRQAEKALETELEEVTTDQPRSIAAGVSLPEDEGVYVYDGKTLFSLAQSQAIIENDRKRTVLGILSPLPVVKGRAWILLPGASAKVSVSSASPVFYLQFSETSAAGYTLVRVQPKKDTRVVGEIQITPLTAKMTESRRLIPCVVEQAFPASPTGDPAVLRLTAKEPLPPGEYALIEFVEKGKQNLFVWDFRVSPQSPNAAKP